MPARSVCARRPCGSPRPRATTRPPPGRTTSWGRPGAGAGHFERSLELSGRLADPSIRIAALNNLARARAGEGDLEPAAELVREALGLVAAQGDRHREAALRNNLADTLHRAGRDDEAMEELKRAVAIFAEVGGHEDEPEPGVWRLVEW